MNALDFLQSEKGFWDHIDTERWLCPMLIPNMLSYGDYDNSCNVHRSNYEVFLDLFGDSPWVDAAHGPYGWRFIAIHPNGLRDNRISETLAFLEEYPVLDEAHYSSLCLELYDEAWVVYGYDELYRGILDQYCLTFWEIDRLQHIREHDPNRLRQAYESTLTSGEYFHDTNPGMVYLLLDYSLSMFDNVIDWLLDDYDFPGYNLVA